MERVIPLLAALVAGLAGCSSSPSEPTSAAGFAGTGVAGVIGMSGSSATGGTPSSGGVTGSGGTAGIGGASALGGLTGTGAAAGAGVARGGTAGVGGTGGLGGLTGTAGGAGAGVAGGTAGIGGIQGMSGAAGAGGARGGSTATGGAGAAGAGGGGGTAGTTGGGGSSSHTGTWHIMPLGDSITGSTCYPQLLSKKLISNGHTNFDFVGSNLNNQSCGTGAPNLMTEGHGGYDVTFLVTDSPPQSGHGTLAELQSWAAKKPDVVLMEYGTNDVWGGISLSSILSAYSFVVEQFRSQNPSVIFFVAQITPMHPSGCSACESNVEALNSMIPAWAAGETSSASPVHVVNVWAALPQASYLPNSEYTSDGVHPNAAGAQLMADAWYAALVAQNIP